MSFPRRRESTDRKILYWVLIPLVTILILFLATIPVRVRSSKNYVKKGDQFLAEKRYLSAELAYRKALTLQSNNKDASERIQLSNWAAVDVTRLKDFYNNNGFSSQGEALKKASDFPENEVAAVKNARDLIEKGEYQLAILPASIATEMDGEYRDAWLYLGIANLKAVQNLEIKTEDKESYLAKAKEALNKAMEIDPNNDITKEYVKETEGNKL